MPSNRLLLLENNGDHNHQLRFALDFMGYEVDSIDAEASIVMPSHTHAEPLPYAGLACLWQDGMSSKLETAARYWPALRIIIFGVTAMPAELSADMRGRILHCQEWPVSSKSLNAVMEKLGEASQEPIAASRPVAVNRITNLAGSSQSMERVRKLILQVAASDSTVLILGESGTGKEVVARNLHNCSHRRQGPFVPVNCGAIPADLLESELFGHEKGAFTGALSSRQGRFEMAEGGTLLLDEIGDMPLPMQVKLLRVLQERSFERVGSNRTIQCNVRVIAATHRDIESEIHQQRFREDLYYRINVFPIELAPLRQRVDDLPELLAEIKGRLLREGRPLFDLTPAAVNVLKQYHWPGNVRELSNLAERLCILYPDMEVDVADLPDKILRHTGFSQPYAQNFEDGLIAGADADDGMHPGSDVVAIMSHRLPEQGLDLKDHLNRLECELIQQALDACGGVVARAAVLLRMRRTTLVEKMRKHGFRGGDDTPDQEDQLSDPSL